MNKLLKLLVNNKKQQVGTPLPTIEMKGEEATLYIYDAIVSNEAEAQFWGGISAEALVPQIRAIKGGTIHLRINSPGGDVFAAQAIVAAIRDTKANVVAHVDGLAASAATIIATSADHIEISAGALYMIHCAMSVAVGNAVDMRTKAELLDKVDSVIASQYAARTGKSAEEVKALMDAETWMTAEEAVSSGFVNALCASKAVKNQWDLSAYDKAPAIENTVETIDQEQREFQARRVRVKTIATNL